jgi:hypothetical protein
MERLSRIAVVLKLIDCFRTAGCWCSETHVQKAVYLLQDLFHVPADYQFVLYKHAPFSFDLTEELSELRSIGLLQFSSQQFPYSPRCLVTDLGRAYQGRYAKTLAKFDAAIQNTSKLISDQPIDKLERLTAALYVTERLNGHHDSAVDGRAKYLNQLRPHVMPLALAKQAVEEIDALMAGSWHELDHILAPTARQYN